MKNELYSGDLPTFYEYHPVSGDDTTGKFVRNINILFNLAKIIKSTTTANQIALDSVILSVSLLAQLGSVCAFARNS